MKKKAITAAQRREINEMKVAIRDYFAKQQHYESIDWEVYETAEEEIGALETWIEELQYGV